MSQLDPIKKSSLINLVTFLFLFLVIILAFAPDEIANKYVIPSSFVTLIFLLLTAAYLFFEHKSKDSYGNSRVCSWLALAPTIGISSNPLFGVVFISLLIAIGGGFVLPKLLK